MNKILLYAISLTFSILTLSWSNYQLPVSKVNQSKTIPGGIKGDQIRYGMRLVAHTSYYLGPKGKVAAMSNGMNCQNCHLEAGTKSFGINYFAVAGSYPKYQARAGAVVSIAQRINGCFERSLNGKKLAPDSKEMIAMIAYMKWLGESSDQIQRSTSGIKKPAYLNEAANPEKGKTVFITKCESCHGKTGAGVINAAGTEYIYPPLWGKTSYNDGAGLYRISNFAGFVKNNMPFGVDYNHPQLSDQEAWDVAAFVNSQPRPHKDQTKDWKDVSSKPIDFPFGPYADNFSESQHKLGPFKPLLPSK